jgi:gamma-glutamyltranspeptidase/glutathione hydrolase
MKKYLVIALLLCSVGCAKKSYNLSDTWVGEPDSGFRQLKVVKAKKSMVVSGSEASSNAGKEILAKGGNAIDAAIAAQLVLNVVEPHSSGIGGGGFLLYYDKKSGETIYFNGRETAPENSRSDMFLDENGKPKKFADAVRGGKSVGTPGLLKALKEAHQRYGKLPWDQLFVPAIKAAHQGFVASQRFHALSKQVSYLKDFDETAEIYLKKDFSAHEVGDKITNPKMAQTLEIIAKEGIDSFYNGKIAADMVNKVQNSEINPGYLSLADLKNYQVKKGDLLCDTYRKKYKICTMPLPAGGSTLLQVLGILENFDLAKLKPNSIESVHLIVEATRLAYADRNEYIADNTNVDLGKLLDKKYLKSRAALIDPKKAISKVSAGKFVANDNNSVVNNAIVELPSTTHISVLDSEGSAVSLTSSIEYFFGSALSVDGFLLNNQLTDFSFEPIKDGKKVANRLEPKKQPRSSMSPTFVFDKKDRLILIVGSPGGPRIIQFVAKTIINHLDFGLDIQQAISLPSFVVLNDVVELEKNQNITELAPKLNQMGHQTKVIEIVSGIHAIALDKNKITGGADPRREGFAVGF